MRKLMSEVSELPLSDEKIEEKFEYKNILYPPKSHRKALEH